MEVMVIGDPNTSANLAAVDANSNLKSSQIAQLGPAITSTVWNSGTAPGTQVLISTVGFSTCTVTLTLAGTITGGQIIFGASTPTGGFHYLPVIGYTGGAAGGNNSNLFGPITILNIGAGTPFTSGNRYSFVINCAGFNSIIVDLVNAIVGAGTVTVDGHADSTLTVSSISEVPNVVYNTSVPTPNNAQLTPLQGDAAANLRINPFGNIGSFTSKSVSGASGANAVLTVPAGKKWLVKSGSAQLVTSASAGNRNMYIIARDAATNNLFQTTALASSTTNVNQTASTTGVYNFAPAVGFPQTALLNTNYIMAFPEIALGPSFTMGTSIVGIVAGDVVTLSINLIEISD
jgi:hypothetical protein